MGKRKRHRKLLNLIVKLISRNLVPVYSQMVHIERRHREFIEIAERIEGRLPPSDGRTITGEPNPKRGKRK